MFDWYWKHFCRKVPSGGGEGATRTEQPQPTRRGAIPPQTCGQLARGTCSGPCDEGCVEDLWFTGGRPERSAWD